VETKPRRFPPQAASSFVIGCLFLVGAIALRIWNPGFSGFFDRGQGEPPLPIWVVLLGLAGLNYAHAGITTIMYRRLSAREGGQPLKPPEE
jgi:hypothetical protein